MTDYTPTTEYIKDSYVHEQMNLHNFDFGSHLEAVVKVRATAEFDRWLETVKAEAIQEVEDKYDIVLEELGY